MAQLPSMTAPEITSAQLDQLLENANRTIELSRAGQDMVRRVGGEPVAGRTHATYLHDEQDWVFLLRPGAVSWPENLYALAEAESHPDVGEVLARVNVAAERVGEQVPAARHAVPGLFGRLFARSRAERGREAAATLERELRAVAPAAARLREILAAVEEADRVQRGGVELIDATTPRHYIDKARAALTSGLNGHIGEPRGYSFVPFEAARHAHVMERAERLKQSENAEPALRRRAEALTGEIAAERAMRLLSQLPTDALRRASAERLRIGGLADAGLHTVADVRAAPLGRLTQISGIGDRTADRLKAAAETLRREAIEAESRSIGQEPTRAARQLVDVLARFAAVDTLEADERARRRRLVSYVDALPGVGRGGTWTAVLTGTEQDNRQWRTFTDDLAWGHAHPQLLDPPPPTATVADPWADYLARPAHYQGLLATLLSDDDGEAGSDLDTRTLEAIRELRLDRTMLADDLHLRGYQSFGARFAVVRRKVIIGDEMGLGKTVQALAAAAHVAATDGVKRTRILVVCPASVVVNWKRESKKFTSLPIYVAHGAVREDAVRAWEGTGGICILTFNGARTTDVTGADVLIVDEAHYVKNPEAQRSRAVKQLIHASSHAILLTGTPLENRVEDFATLVNYVDPDLLGTGHDTMSALDFRKRIAPVYLRRNQDDVLDELPGITEQPDWVELTAGDEDHYRDAVVDGNWMAVRRAPLLTPGTTPAKIERIKEIVAEAQEADRRVVIFSYFLDVLDRLETELGSSVLATITGAMNPGERQRAVDKLDDARAGSVLLAQINAGGTGLNMQAASVVVIAEPQVKPSIEAQAVARVNRMGQTRSVLAHRILAEDTVDERMLEMLGRKEQIFDAFARESVSAGVPDAVDVSEPKLARDVIAAERARLGIDQEE